PSMPQVALTPPAIAQRYGADWGLIRPEQVDVIRHEPFDYEFTGPRHLLIASERAERDDGETLLDGLPRSSRREWNRKMTFVPAGPRFFGWPKPRSLVRSPFPLHRPTQPAARRSRLRRHRFPSPIVLLRRRRLDDRAEAQGAARASMPIAERLCGRARHRPGARAHARQRRRSACRRGAAWRAAPLAAEEAGRIYRRASCRRDLALVLGSRGAAEPLPFLPRVQAVVRHAAAPVSREPAHRARQGLAGRARAVGDGDRARRRV